MSYTVGNLHNIQASRIFFKGDVVHWLLMYRDIASYPGSSPAEKRGGAWVRGYRDTHAELTRHNSSSNLRITNIAKIVIQAAAYAQG